MSGDKIYFKCIFTPKKIYFQYIFLVNNYGGGRGLEKKLGG